MTVQAGLVAFVAQVDLQHIQGVASDGGEIGCMEQGQSGSHGVLLGMTREIKVVYTPDRLEWLKDTSILARPGATTQDFAAQA